MYLRYALCNERVRSAATFLHYHHAPSNVRYERAVRREAEEALASPGK